MRPGDCTENGCCAIPPVRPSPGSAGATAGRRTPARSAANDCVSPAAGHPAPPDRWPEGIRLLPRLHPAGSLTR